MYFYRVVSGDYESHNERTFVSEVEYTKEELEDIMVDTYRASCEYIINKEEHSVCFDLNFTPDDRLFDTYEGFSVKYLRDKYGLIILEPKVNVFIDSTHYGRSNELNERFCKALDSLFIDESCWDNHCSRLSDETEFPSWYRDKCLVYKKKQARIKERSCDNCEIAMKYESCKQKANPCDEWIWNGDGTLKQYGD